MLGAPRKFLVVFSHNRLTGITTFCFTVARWLATHGYEVRAHIVFRESTMDLVESKVAASFSTSFGTQLPTERFDAALVSDAKSLAACAPWPCPVFAFAHGLGPLAHEYTAADATRITRLFATSPFMQRTYAARLPTTTVTFFPNVIDTVRFAPSGEMRTPPRFALLNDRRRAPEYMQRVAPVFERFGLTLVPVAELEFGLPIWAMEDVYPRFDLVVGCGRSAYEAMSCGRPVLVLGVNGGDGLLTRATFDAAFDRNCSGFGIRALRWDDPSLEAALETELAKPRDSSEANRALALEHVSADKVMPRLVEAAP